MTGVWCRATRLGLAAFVVARLLGVGGPAFSQEPPADVVADLERQDGHTIRSGLSRGNGSTRSIVPTR